MSTFKVILMFLLGLWGLYTYFLRTSAKETRKENKKQKTQSQVAKIRLPEPKQTNRFSLTEAQIEKNVAKAQKSSLGTVLKALASHVFNNILMKQYARYDFSRIVPYKPKSYVMVQNEVQLRQMAKELKSCKIIGVDLENNHTQSYNGFTCLI